MAEISKGMKSASILFHEVSADDEADWTKVKKTLHVGSAKPESIYCYNNIVIKTVVNQEEEVLSKLEIDLSDVISDSPVEELTIKLRKVQICDDNGKNAYIYMLCSESFEEDQGFLPPAGLGP
tara:strand:+ start:267 stop:635 length:369 start_codon:yes stop_codon:yes gene_type:complete